MLGPVTRENLPRAIIASPVRDEDLQPVPWIVAGKD
jgi:hypothetical protein